MANFGPVVLVCIGLVLLDLAAWAVLLGGAASLQKDALTISTLINSMPATLTYGDVFPNSRPGNFISYEWFKAVFQVLTLLFALAVLVTGQLYRFRLALVGLFAALLVLWCDACQTFYYIRTQVDAAEALTGASIARRVRTWWAGCIMTAAINGMLIIALGSGLGESYDAEARHTRTRQRDTFPDENKAAGNGAAV